MTIRFSSVPSLVGLLFLICLMPSLAQAHPGHDHYHSHGFLHGFAHPFLGLDHILAMVAVGLWAVQLGGRALWLVPASFIGAMVIGGIIGMAGFHIPLLEQGIACSVLLLGLLIAFAVRLPVVYPALLVAVFAVFHGVAHGGEMPAAAAAIPYAIGFTMATAVLHGIGIGTGMLLGQVAPMPVLRGIGACVALGGVALFFLV